MSNKTRLHIFTLNDISYCVNCETYEMLIIPRELIPLCEVYAQRDVIPKQDKSLLKQFLDFIRVNERIFKMTATVIPNSTKMPIFSFCPAHQCNFECRYCFARKEATVQYNQKAISLRIVDLIFDYMLKKFPDFNKFRLEFVSGGEPLMNFASIKHACNLSRNLFESSGKEFMIQLVTNGTMLTWDILEFLQQHPVSIGISFEGTEANQNYLRIMKNHENSYEAVKFRILEIINSERYHNLAKGIWIISIVTSYCTSLVEIVESNIALGIHSMEMRIARGPENNELFMNYGNIAHFKTLYLDLFAYLELNIKQNNLKPLLMILNNYDFFGKIIKRIICKEHVLFRCGAGVSKFAFSADGDIYPCDSFVGEKEFLMGKVTEPQDILTSTPFIFADINHRNPCSLCKFRYLCAGDCYYNSYVNNQDIYNSDTAFCIFMQFICDLSFKFVGVLQTQDGIDIDQLSKYLKKRDMINHF
ncbi:MAG: radical SAM protein [Mobilitalea sp.]